jgi:hypothetical protein
MGSMCQSCGMPLRKDPQVGGTNQDGTKSTEYCSYCYQNGNFVDNETDVKKYQSKVLDIMASQGFWRPIAWLMTRGIPNLKRWKK